MIQTEEAPPSAGHVTDDHAEEALPAADHVMQTC